MEKIIIAMSGGMDSSTLLGYLLEQGYDVICVNFQYGSKHNSFELSCYNRVIQYYRERDFNVVSLNLDLTQQFAHLKSNLLMTGGEIPEGHYNDTSMAKTVVPGRNLIFASFLAAIAESYGAKEVALGVHSGDHHIYPDCRPEFMAALRETVKNSTDGKVTVRAPFLYHDKARILQIGYSIRPEVPYKFTRTCYKNQEKSCGKCGSCTERLEAFALIGEKDPIEYE